MTPRPGLLARVSAACLAVALAGAAVPSVAATPAAPDPVVARVDGQPIHLSDIQAEVATLPPQLRKLPSQRLYPALLQRIIDERALLAEARRQNLQSEPAVQKDIAAATNHVLENALLSKEVGPTVTEAAVHARYEKEYAGKPGPEEVHAKHILVDSKALAEKIIAQLEKGADFATLAKKYSKDPGGADGGDLGFFKKDEMVPAFSDAAFALKPGQFTHTPVHTQFGWHVILVVARRQAPPPSFDQVKDKLRQQMIKEEVQKVVAKARADAKVEVFNLDGSPVRATDTAKPPPAGK